MATKSYTTHVTGISREKIWALWVDVNNWHRWDEDIEYARLEGEHKVGAIFTLKPKGGPLVKIKLVELRPLEKFTDCTYLPLCKMLFIHEMFVENGGLRLTTTVKLTGILAFFWQKMMADKIVAGLPKQTAKLVEFARQT